MFREEGIAGRLHTSANNLGDKRSFLKPMEVQPRNIGRESTKE